MRAVALVALGLLSVLVLPRTARADDVDTCANAFEAAQRLHKKDDPKAVTEASTCARDVCPDVLRKECVAWVKEWTPAEKPAPKPEPATTPTITTTRAQPKEKEEESDETIEPSRPVPVLTYVLGGGALVAFGVASGFALHGVSIRNDLERSGCEPNCASDRVDEAKRSFIVADVFAIAGIAALGGSLAIYLTRPEVKGDAKSASRSHVAIAPLLGGAALRGSF